MNSSYCRNALQQWVNMFITSCNVLEWRFVNITM